MKTEGKAATYICLLAVGCNYSGFALCQARSVIEWCCTTCHCMPCDLGHGGGGGGMPHHLIRRCLWWISFLRQIMALRFPRLIIHRLSWSNIVRIWIWTCIVAHDSHKALYILRALTWKTQGLYWEMSSLTCVSGRDRGYSSLEKRKKFTKASYVTEESFINKTKHGELVNTFP